MSVRTHSECPAGTQRLGDWFLPEPLWPSSEQPHPKPLRHPAHAPQPHTHPAAPGKPSQFPAVEPRPEPTSTLQQAPPASAGPPPVRLFISSYLHLFPTYTHTHTWQDGYKCCKIFFWRRNGMCIRMCPRVWDNRWLRNNCTENCKDTSNYSLLSSHHSVPWKIRGFHLEDRTGDWEGGKNLVFCI